MAKIHQCHLLPVLYVSFFRFPQLFHLMNNLSARYQFQALWMLGYYFIRKKKSIQITFFFAGIPAMIHNLLIRYFTRSWHAASMTGGQEKSGLNHNIIQNNIPAQKVMFNNFALPNIVITESTKCNFTGLNMSVAAGLRY